MDNNNNGGAHYALSLRAERPIEHCELLPHAFLCIRGGAMDNLTRQKMMDANPHYFSFRWLRGPKLALCAYPLCSRSNTYDPIQWSKAARGGSGLHCAVCEKARIPKHEALFCSLNCFKQAWKDHSIKHTNLGKEMIPKTFSKPSLLSDEENTDLDVANAMDSGAGAGQPFSDGIPESEWVEVSQEQVFCPTELEVGSILRVEVSALTISDSSLLAGPMCIYTEPVLAAPAAPPKRQLSMIQGATVGTATAFRFRICSYNILAELYATRQAYPNCDSWSLAWAYRRNLIMKEIEEAQGDIICLQEVQADHFEQHINPIMSELGYDGIYKQKSRETSGGYGKVDGCATFWKRQKFVLTENYTIEFNECARQAAADLGLDEQQCRRYMNRLSRDNIAQIVVLDVISRNRQLVQICVANTHLYSNVQRPDVKLWQTLTLIRELEQFILQRDVALMICGDFNSEPDSAVYEFLSEGAIQSDRPELESDDNLRVLPDLHHIAHSIELASMMEATGSEPLFTNYTVNFKGTLDYIWYTPSRLRVMAVSNIPSESDLISSEVGLEGLPSANYPSDHLMLCCDVALCVSGSGLLTRQTAQRKTSQRNSRMH